MHKRRRGAAQTLFPRKTRNAGSGVQYRYIHIPTFKSYNGKPFLKTMGRSYTQTRTPATSLPSPAGRGFALTLSKGLR